ncbi:MAG TPA: MoaD/ThiS family protein [Thermodesulfobacteriota bacterium]|nr:MoaD/ThiS family protein [Thermodesulfobacteriota bacterium]
MMVRVAGREIFWREGMTVSDVLNELGDAYPYPVVRIRDRFIAKPDFDKATVPNNSEVHLIPLVAGG